MNAIKKAFSNDSDKVDRNGSHGSEYASNSRNEANARSSIDTSTGTNAGPRTSTGPTGPTANLDSSGNRGSTGSTGGMTGGNTGATGASTTGEHHGLLSKLEGNHTSGHARSREETDPKSGHEITHDTKHLGEITHERRHHHETQEVLREREHERHIHHVQHHVQPVKDETILDDQHHHKAVPVTQIRENHSSNDQDRAAFAELGKAHQQGSLTHVDGQKRVVDLGENVNEHVHHHVHNVVQPVIHHDKHEHHKHHVVIPTHHVTHEAPIVHQSNQREMLSKEDFLSGGGQLGSKLSHNDAGVLANGNCEREVDGVGERMAKELGIGNLIGSGKTTGTTGAKSTI